MLIEDYLEALQSGDTICQANIMLGIIEEITSGINEKVNKAFIEERKNVIDFYVWQAIANGDVDSVRRWTGYVTIGNSNTEGRAAFLLGNMNRAEKLLSTYAEEEIDADEEALFYLGQVFLKQGKYKGAFEVFSRAAEQRKSFMEAGTNAVCAYSLLTGGPIGHYTSESKVIAEALRNCCPLLEAGMSDFAINEERMEEVWNLPIFINSRDRLSCLKQLIEWLLKAGYKNLILLDNDSSYPPLLEYYRVIEADSRIRVVRLGKNLGHKALWDCGILEELDIKTPYAYTDSDVLPIEECPDNFVQELLRILRKYPGVKKAGPGLYLDDLPESKREIVTWEKQFYTAPIANDLYYGPIDTTFAVYRNVRKYVIKRAIRTRGNIQVRHLPWYYNGYGDMPEDERYYGRHANRSSHISKAFAEQSGNEGGEMI